jgi:hypothetical protein
MTIWVDSICINQEDEVEKSCQIPLVATIYSRAESVIIWLGAGTKASDDVINYFKNVGFQRLLVKDGDLVYKIPSGCKFLWKAAWMATVWTRSKFV